MPNIEHAKAMSIVGLERRTTNERAFEEIPAHWQRFYKDGVLDRISGKLSNDIYAVYTRFENESRNNEGTYSFIIGAQVADLTAVPLGLSGVFVSASRFAVFPVERGHPEQVGERWRKIWALTDLSKTFVCDYERYRANGEIDIFVGVR